MTVPSPLPLTDWLDTARQAAEAAALVHVIRAGSVHADGAREKGTADFVSQVDEEAQAAALDVIRMRHPDHLVLAEEDDTPPAFPDDGTPIWIVDPLDGTTNFLHGHPMHVASVAVAQDNRLRAGAVTCGPSRERWWGAEGMGAFKDTGFGSGRFAADDGTRLRTAEPTPMRRALIGTGFPFKDMRGVDDYLAQLGRVLAATAGARRGGAAALDLCYVAEGRFDGFWEAFLNPWDFAAGALLITEAGGAVGRIEGDALGVGPGSVIAAASEAFMSELRAWLLGSDAPAPPA